MKILPFIPVIYHNFLFILCPDVSNTPYTAVLIKGDPKTATGHAYMYIHTLTDVGESL
jgi:hypothetical protein